MIFIQDFKQDQHPWNSLNIAPYTTIGSKGCFLTTCASIFFPILRMNPGELYSAIKPHHAFDGEGNLNWDSFIAAFDGKYMMTRRVHTTNNPNDLSKMDAGEAIRRVERLLSLGQAVGLCVDATKDGKPDHMVACYDRVSIGGKVTDFNIMDPLTGKRHLFSERYGDIKTKLYGYAAFAYPSATYPDWSTEENMGAAQYKAAVLKMNMSSVLSGVAKTYASEIYDSITAPK